MPSQATTLTAEQMRQFILTLSPRLHGHLVKALTAFALALLLKTSGCQAELARAFASFEAASRRLTRLLHNPHLSPRQQADAMLAYGLARLPARGPVRLVVDWTSEGTWHLLVISLVVGRRALPLYWRAYAADTLKGRMRRYEFAVLHRALTAVVTRVGRRRVQVLADRGFADVELCTFLADWGITYLIRAKGSTKVYVGGTWQRLDQLRFRGNGHCRALGQVRYCESAPHRLWVSLGRRKHAGQWQHWYVLSNRALPARDVLTDYGRRMGAEEGFRDAKWWLGFADAQIQDVQAWARLFGLCALTMWAVMAVAHAVLLAQPARARKLLRCVCARRRGRWPLSVFKAMLCLLQQHLAWLEDLVPNIGFDLEAQLPNPP